jgi:hypothetical protein
MKNKLILHVLMFMFVSIYCITGPLYAQSLAPQITADQARQIMLTYIQAPDTDFAPADAYLDDSSHHQMYNFYGNKGIQGNDQGFTYTIDAVTLEKSIYTGADHTGSNGSVMSRNALEQLAKSFFKAHYPVAYQIQMVCVTDYKQDNSPINQTEDNNDFSGDFVCINYLPCDLNQCYRCSVDLREDTGQLTSYDERCIPLTISATPAINASQAVSIAQLWVQNNISSDSASYQIETAYSDPEWLQVLIDSNLNQTLT